MRFSGGVGLVLCVGVLWVPASSGAAPDDDYRSGLASYQSGDVGGAMKTLRAAADAGHAKAQALYAFILERSGSPADAERYYTLAAEQGEADAELNLAHIYLGRGGQDKAALALLVRAADRGHATAIETVADVYLKQRLGLVRGARDDKLARVAITRAAERDYLPAIDGLAAAYRSGDFGLVADATAAARWQARGDQLRKQRADTSKRSSGAKK